MKDMKSLTLPLLSMLSLILILILGVYLGCERPASSESYFRPVVHFAIEIPPLSQPTLEDLREEYSWIDGIERDNSPTHNLKLTLGTVFQEREARIEPEEYQRRLEGVPALGYQHLEWLVQHQDQHPYFRDFLWRVEIDAPALVVIADDGTRLWPGLVGVNQENERRWALTWREASSDPFWNVHIATYE